MTDQPSNFIADKDAAEHAAGQKVGRSRGPFVLANGRIYFSRQTERKIFFVLTVLMLIYGICTRTGLF